MQGKAVFDVNGCYDCGEELDWEKKCQNKKCRSYQRKQP